MDLLYDWYDKEVLNLKKPLVRYDNLLFMTDAIERVGKGIFEDKWAGNERLALTELEAAKFNVARSKLGLDENLTPDEGARERFNEAVSILANWLANGRLMAQQRAVDENRWQEKPDWEEVPKAFWETREAGSLEFRVGRCKNEDDGGAVWRGWVFIYEKALHSQIAAERQKRGLGELYKSGAPGRPTSKHLITAELERMIEAGLVPSSLHNTAKILKTWLEEQRLPPMGIGSIENIIRNRFNALKS